MFDKDAIFTRGQNFAGVGELPEGVSSGTKGYRYPAPGSSEVKPFVPRYDNENSWFDIKYYTRDTTRNSPERPVMLTSHSDTLPEALIKGDRLGSPGFNVGFILLNPIL